MLKASLSQNPVGFGKGFGKSGQRPVFSVKSKVAFPKAEILGKPQASSYLKSEGRRSVRLHFSHSAIFLTFPFSKRVFILTSPPQEQKNFWVALEVREFLLA
jgi:hypothetical protein